MEKSDFELVQEIQSVTTDHLAAIKKEAPERVLKLDGIDRERGLGRHQQRGRWLWERHAHRCDALAEAQATDYSSRRWRAVTGLRPDD
jgi:hypothetical protein